MKIGKKSPEANEAYLFFLIAVLIAQVRFQWSSGYKSRLGCVAKPPEKADKETFGALRVSHQHELANPFHFLLVRPSILEKKSHTDR